MYHSIECGVKCNVFINVVFTVVKVVDFANFWSCHKLIKTSCTNELKTFKFFTIEIIAKNISNILVYKPIDYVPHIHLVLCKCKRVWIPHFE